MTNYANFIAVFVLLSCLGISCSEEIPKFSHVNVTFRFGLDEREFVETLKEHKVEYEEGRREGHRHKVIQEYILKETSIPAFEDAVKKLELSRTEYTKPYEEYVKLFVQTDELHKKLVEAGINLRELKHGKNDKRKAYIVEVSLIPQIEAIAKQSGATKIVYNKTRLRWISVTYKRMEDEAETQKRFQKYNVHVEEIKTSDHDKWDQEYYHGKYDVDYFVDPSRLEDFAYALGVTLL